MVSIYNPPGNADTSRFAQLLATSAETAARRNPAVSRESRVGELTPTPEQLAIVAAARESSDSLMVTAYAGCAKTTSIEMLAHAMPSRPTLALAFNVRIKKELEKRMPSHVDVLTLNGLGHRAWTQALGKRLSLDDKKLGRLVSATAKGAGFAITQDQWDSARRLVTLAMQAGLVPSTFPTTPKLVDTPEAWHELAEANWLEATEGLIDLARAILIASIREAYAGTISFDDQIYCSTMLGGVFPKYPVVLVDEAQDLSMLNHIQLARSASDRIIAVGDPKQAIYSFRGADSASMGKIRALRPTWQVLPLATTFRCPKAIVARQQRHAPGFTSAPSAPAGQVVRLPVVSSVVDDGAVRATWTWDDVAAIAAGRPIAVLCRNNAPLLSHAFRLIRRRVGCHMLGRDIGKGLSALARKLFKNENPAAVACANTIHQWAMHECDLAKANGKEEKCERVMDQAECLQAVLDGSACADARGLLQAIDSLFAREDGLVTLATGHRAKGLEWPVVLHLDPWRVPSRQARAALAAGNPVPIEQEMNLLYVIETRVQSVLINASAEDYAN